MGKEPSDKDYYYRKVQTLHNRFVRSVITSLCKIILWAIVYSAIVGIASAVIGGATASSAASAISTSSTLSSYSSSSKSTEKSDSGDSSGVIVSGWAVIVLASIVCCILVAKEMIERLNESKRLRKYEEAHIDDLSIEDFSEKEANAKKDDEEDKREDEDEKEEEDLL